jgi:methylthioxylose transferase
VVATVAILAGVVTGGAPWLRGPAPYPPEWQWLRRGPLDSGPIGPALAVAAALLAVVLLSGAPWVLRAPRRAAALVAAAVGLGFLFQLAVLQLEPEGALQAVMNQTVYRTATSYHTVAASEDARDPLAFLRRHHDLLPDLRKAGKHASTHPPGGVLYFRGLLALFERSPALTRAVLEGAGFDEVNPRRPRPQHTPAARAAALVGGLLIGLLCAATAWPIAAFARRAGAHPVSAARVALLWALLPGPVLMTPMLDQALCLPVAAATACLAAAMAEPARETRLAALAGLFGGLAVFVSYGAPLFLAFGGCAALALGLGAPGGVRRAATVAAIAGGVTTGLWMLPAALGHRPWASLATALAIHRDDYTLPRSYALWLLFNPLDLALFLGVPVAVAWAVRTWRSAVRSPREGVDHLRLATGLGLLALLLAGQTRGEVGRIWLPLMPALLVAAMARPDGPTRGEALLCGTCLAALTIAMAAFWQVP